MEPEILFYKSPLGVIEIRGTATVVTHVLFINSWKGTKADEDALQFLQPQSAAIKNCVQQLNEYFEGKRFVFDLPVEQSGTVFQRTVWQALLHIPYGKTISYLELSRRIQNVKAIRAVGTANGSNSVSIIVPCHRVIGSNGSLVGYGGDLWRKQWLLQHEAKYMHGVQTLF
jgi:methylated-DNA-[protein]-cysteine S-methyltransferase